MAIYMNHEADSKKRRYQLCSRIDHLSNQHRFWIHCAKDVNGMTSFSESSQACTMAVMQMWQVLF